MSPTPSPLVSIIAHARSGALDHAWRLYREAGLEGVSDDPAVLSVRGRLLKDRALAADGEERRRFYLEAADAYGRAGEIDGATYPLINASTLSLLAGQADQARLRATQVLTRLDQGDEADTPYWREATRAEALLLLGRTPEARSTLAGAIARAPRAWEDHASTLRQFGLILGAQAEDRTWLDAMRPPRSLHFAGHMALDPGPGAARDQIEAVLEAENVGFGFGALAAGADIVIAESLLARGAELHLLLPTSLKAFRAASVERFGIAWTARFDAVIAQAETLRTVGDTSTAPRPLDIQLAAEISMGAAVMQAHALTSEAIQLLVLDSGVSGPNMSGASAWIGAIWEKSGRRQTIVAAPRTDPPLPAPVAPASPAPALLAAMLAIEVRPDTAPGIEAMGALARDTLPRLARLIADGPHPMAAPRWSGDTLTVAYAKPSEAAAAALAVTAGMKESDAVRIGAHYGIVHRIEDPFGSAPLLLGAAARLAGQVVASAPPRAVHVTEDFAAALHAAAAGQPRAEYVGDLPPTEIEDELRLFSLKR